jgi:hypothetical protein
MADELFSEKDLIYKYTSDQAEEDGILFNVTQIKLFEKSPFNYITTNLLNEGYIQKDEIEIANLLDLLNQAINIVRRSKPDYFYSGLIELPSGKKTKIFIVQNETGKFTIMKPEDY